MKNRYMFVVLSVLLCYLSIACQRHVDYASSVKDESHEVLVEKDPSRSEKEKRWEEGFAYVTKLLTEILSGSIMVQNNLRYGL